MVALACYQMPITSVLDAPWVVTVQTAHVGIVIVVMIVLDMIKSAELIKAQLTHVLIFKQQPMTDLTEPNWLGEDIVSTRHHVLAER